MEAKGLRNVRGSRPKGSKIRFSLDCAVQNGIGRSLGGRGRIQGARLEQLEAALDRRRIDVLAGKGLSNKIDVGCGNLLLLVANGFAGDDRFALGSGTFRV
jgi:hypothetical protein